MFKTKKLMIMSVVFVLGASLLFSFAFGQEGEKSAEVNTVTATATGILKEIDANAGTVTIVPVSGEELIFTLKEESKIQIGGSLSDLTQLAVNSKVTVEYQVEERIVTVISVE